MTRLEAVEHLARKVEAMDPPTRLRLAADMLEESAAQGGVTSLTQIAHSITESVAMQLGIAILLRLPQTEE